MYIFLTEQFIDIKRTKYINIFNNKYICSLNINKCIFS